MMWLAVALGGALGSLLRYGLSILITPQPHKFPWATFLANAGGCFLMGIFFALIFTKHIWPAEWRPFLMVGFLGGLTTFSSFALEGFILWQAQLPLLAGLYVFSSVLSNLILVAVGYFLVDSIFT